MYRLKVKDSTFTIPKMNICLLAMQKSFDTGVKPDSDLRTQDGAISYLRRLGIAVEEVE